MAVNRVPVLKRCRSLGLEPAVLGIDKKSNRQLKRSSRKVSEYGLQLREKQKAKFIYGVLEKPFRNYYKKADQMKGMTGENLMAMLEMRLDNVIFRLGYARTRREARQIVDHRHVLVNGKLVNIPSYQVKAGDKVEIKEGKRSSARYKGNGEDRGHEGILAATAGRMVPEWLEADRDNLSGVVKEVPRREAIDVPVNEMLIVELYSK
ncbi:MAG: 30S ribosomal protein S4 [Lachnospiraceae bacterium]|nr:30S ribosomal protein S4 [Lachnospiraceae bacterium]